MDFFPNIIFLWFFLMMITLNRKANLKCNAFFHSITALIDFWSNKCSLSEHKRLIDPKLVSNVSYTKRWQAYLE